MGRPKAKDDDAQKFSKPGIRTKIFVREDMIGGGKITLLKYLGEVGSISGAAAKMGISYRRAWFLLDTLQRCFDAPLYISQRGGAKSGGTDLTPLGAELIKRYTETSAKIEDAGEDLLKWLQENQKTDPSA